MKAVAKAATFPVVLLILAVAVSEANAARNGRRGRRGQHSHAHSSSDYGQTQWRHSSSSPHSHGTVYHWTEYQPTPAAPRDASYPVEPVAMTERPGAASRLVQQQVPQAPVVPPGANLPRVLPGSQLTLTGSQLGNMPGMVIMQLSGVTLPVEILNWSDDAVIVRLPAMLIQWDTPAQLIVGRADRSVALATDVVLPAS